jgi:sodium/proline symporter
MSVILASFLLFLAGFTLIGLWSFRASRATQKDYYLADNSVSPWLAGLSAMATNNSGYMFIGVIGYTYTTGLAAVWLMVGWILGDFLGSLFIHRQLHQATLRTDEHSFLGVLSHWQGRSMPILRMVGSLLALLFLMAYASAQLVAGSKALWALLEWPQYAGALVGAVIVAAYCMAGGIRASIWTDAAQAFVMVGAMGVLLWAAVGEVGGVSAALQALHQIPGYMAVAPEQAFLPGWSGAALLFVGWLFAGISVVGQPHVMVRFMALRRDGDMLQARLWYYLWFAMFYCLATAVGLLTRALLPDSASFDAELALPTLALALLPPVLVGLILAGIFAATISTADSLVLACSSIVVCDLKRDRSHLRLAKVATLLTVLGALCWALLNQQSVFNLVVMAWSTLAAAFAPLLVLLALGRRVSEKAAVLMMLLGVGTALGWRFAGLHQSLYEGLPAICLALLFYPVFNRWLPWMAITGTRSPV